ncbi:MAG: lipopolysaccharide biosynthesis protein [Tsuneonella sp.]
MNGASTPETPIDASAHDGSLRQASANTAKSVLIQFVSLCTTLVDRIFLAAILIRFWGTEGFSDWTTIVSAAGIVLIAEFGFQQFVGNQLLKAHFRERSRAFDRLVGWAVFTSLAIGLFVTVVIALVAVWTPLASLLHLYDAEFVPALLILCVSNMLKVVRGPILQVYRGLGEFHSFIWADARATMASVLLAIAAVMLDAGVIVVAAIYLLATFVASIAWSLRDIARRFPHVRFRPLLPGWRPTARGLLALRWYGLFFVLSTVMQSAPILIIAMLGMSGQLLASFAVERTLVNFVRTVAFGISNAAGAELSVLNIRGNADGFLRGLRLLGRLNSCLAALAVSGLYLFNDTIVRAWTGQANLATPAVLALLLIPAIAVAPALALQQAAVMLDKVRAQSLASALSAFIAIGGGIVLGKLYGIVGIAAAAAAGETLAIGIIAPLSAAKDLRISYLPVAFHSAVAFIATLAWGGLTGWVIEQAPLGTSLAGAVVRMAAWGAVACLPAAWLCSPPAMRRQLIDRLTQQARFTHKVGK